MAETIAGITVPDSALVRETTELVRRAADESLFNHSRRVFLFGMLKSAARGLEVDPELAYVGAMFHDLGLTDEYRTQDQRFEIDGAAAAVAESIADAYGADDPDGDVAGGAAVDTLVGASGGAQGLTKTRPGGGKGAAGRGAR